MKLAATAAMLLVAGAFAYGCSTSDVGNDSQDVTGCEGAHWDANGRCRNAGGRFAKKACCEQLASKPYPEERRTLDAFNCPAGEALIPVAFFDADSTLRISRSGAPTANDADDVYVLPFVATQIKALNESGYLVAIVSNQGGVSAGHTTLEVAQAALVYIAEQLNEVESYIDYIDFADKNDVFRKPKTGMAEHLDALLQEKCDRGIDFAGSFMIGDAGYKQNEVHPDGRPGDDFSNSDRLFAENLGIPFTEPHAFFGWSQWGKYNIHDQDDLLELLDAIDAEIAALAESGEDPVLQAALEAEVAHNRAMNDL